MCPVPPRTAAPLPALLQHWLCVRFQDLLLQTDVFVPAELLNRILAAWVADTHHINLYRRTDNLLAAHSCRSHSRGAVQTLHQPHNPSWCMKSPHLPQDMKGPIQNSTKHVSTLPPSKRSKRPVQLRPSNSLHQWQLQSSL